MFSIHVPLGHAQAATSPQAKAVLPAANLSAVSVLCIDNEVDILRGMRSLLQGWGCRVVTATSLEEALRHWGDTTPPQLAIVDYHLDRSATGVDALDALCQHWNTDIPGILVSADISEPVRNSAAERGWFYLAKPVKAAALRNLIRRLARRESV